MRSRTRNSRSDQNFIEMLSELFIQMTSGVSSQSCHENLSTPSEEELRFRNLLSTKIFDDQAKRCWDERCDHFQKEGYRHYFTKKNRSASLFFCEKKTIQSKFCKEIFLKTKTACRARNSAHQTQTKGKGVEDTPFIWPPASTLVLSFFARAFPKPYQGELEPVEKVLRRVLPRS